MDNLILQNLILRFAIMENLIIAVISIFASGGFWSFIQYKAAKKDQNRSALEAGVLSLLHNRIYKLATEVIKRGYITPGELDDLENLFRPYKALGGNGTGHGLYERAKKQPLKEEV